MFPSFGSMFAFTLFSLRVQVWVYKKFISLDPLFVVGLCRYGMREKELSMCWWRSTSAERRGVSSRSIKICHISAIILWSNRIVCTCFSLTFVLTSSVRMKFNKFPFIDSITLVLSLPWMFLGLLSLIFMHRLCGVEKTRLMARNTLRSLEQSKGNFLQLSKLEVSCESIDKLAMHINSCFPEKILQLIIGICYRLRRRDSVEIHFLADNKLCSCMRILPFHCAFQQVSFERFALDLLLINKRMTSPQTLSQDEIRTGSINLLPAT